MIAHDDVFPYLTAENMVPSLSATRSSMRAAGARSADLVLQLLSGRPTEEVHELWPVELILRESTAPPPRMREDRLLTVPKEGGLGKGVEAHHHHHGHDETRARTAVRDTGRPR